MQIMLYIPLFDMRRFVVFQFSQVKLRGFKDSKAGSRSSPIMEEVVKSVPLPFLAKTCALSSQVWPLWLVKLDLLTGR